MTNPLAIVAAAWAERKGEAWRHACDRVAMGFICDNPDAKRRAEMVIEYRQRCHIEEVSRGARE